MADNTDNLTVDHVGLLGPVQLECLMTMCMNTPIISFTCVHINSFTDRNRLVSSQAVLILDRNHYPIP